MKLVYLILIVGWAGLTACNSRNHAVSKEQDSSNPTAVIKITPADTLVSNSLKKIALTPTSVIKVISITWALKDATPNDSMVYKCKNWSLTNESIETILKNGDPIDMHDFSYLYYVLPCEVKGSVEIDRKLFSYSINAGSFFTISNDDTTNFYGCNAPACKKFFLMEGGDPKRDIE
ncbi:hypothetical protein [Chitinophaga rhizosphaerae]|uniref:hypothetical protein n=1 Tax=Chitinophaga rhizosphaerae TaxID=1864947 RepID=UPI000F7FC0B7|nr:hypothetical protein [Chitinophaga rhizosphaerae]